MIRLLGVLLVASEVAAAAGPLPQEADQLGRLFTTPEQRRLLDLSQAKKAENDTPPPAPAPPPRPHTARLDGIVLRGDRPVACWLDGVWQPEGDQCLRRP